MNDPPRRGHHRAMHRLALVAPLLVTAAAHAEPEPLPLAVHGAIDVEPLRARLAAELRRPVVAVEACTAPCLDVSVAAGSASVGFTPARGEARVRIVELGDDRAQWPVLVTLLAGNLVRDEAADLLAQLPAPAAAPAVAPPAPAPALAPVAPPPPPSPAVAPLAPAPVVHAPGLDRPAVAPRALHPLERGPERVPELFAIGLVPGLSTDGLHAGRAHLASLDLLIGVSGGSNLFTVSGLADLERGEVSGLQLAGIATAAPRVSGLQIAGRARGVQVGGIVAVAPRDADIQLAGIAAATRGSPSLQIGGIVAAAGESAGAQLGGIAAVTRGSADAQVGGIVTFAGAPAVQGAGIAALARRDAGVQLAGIAAVAGGDANVQVAGIAGIARDANVQIAGIANITRDANVQVAGIAGIARDANVQIAGIANIARRLRGAQIAPVNIAARVDGVQVGVVNIGGAADGVSLGLINIVPGGRTDVEATVDSSRIGTLLLRHGGQRWHNVYGVAGHPVEEAGPADRSDDVWMYGLGFGPSWRSRRTRVDLEAMGWQVNHGARHSTDVSILGQLRLTLAVGLGPVAVVAGGALNAYVSNDHASPLLVERRVPGTPMRSDVTVEIWPSAFVGLRM